MDPYHYLVPSSDQDLPRASRRHHSNCFHVREEKQSLSPKNYPSLSPRVSIGSLQKSSWRHRSSAPAPALTGTRSPRSRHRRQHQPSASWHSLAATEGASVSLQLCPRFARWSSSLAPPLIALRPTPRSVRATCVLEADERRCYTEGLKKIRANGFTEILVLDGCFMLDLFLWKGDRQLAHMSSGGAIELGEASSARAMFFRAADARSNSRSSVRSSISRGRASPQTTTTTPYPLRVSKKSMGKEKGNWVGAFWRVDDGKEEGEIVILFLNSSRWKRSY